MNASSKPELPCSDAAVRGRTGRDWAEWKELLAAEGGDAMSHRELARLVHTHHEAGGWWSQMVAVGFERMTGKREVGQTCNGDFQANVSRTLPLADFEAYRWLTDDKLRNRWLDIEATVRTATAPKSVRLGLPDETIAAAWITPKGAAKCAVAIAHTKLEDADAVAEARVLWADAFQRLRNEILN